LVARTTTVSALITLAAAKIRDGALNVTERNTTVIFIGLTRTIRTASASPYHFFDQSIHWLLLNVVFVGLSGTAKERAAFSLFNKENNTF
jgi:hypothetical protein